MFRSVVGIEVSFTDNVNTDSTLSISQLPEDNANERFKMSDGRNEKYKDGHRDFNGSHNFRLETGIKDASGDKIPTI